MFAEPLATDEFQSNHHDEKISQLACGGPPGKQQKVDRQYVTAYWSRERSKLCGSNLRPRPPELQSEHW